MQMAVSVTDTFYGNYASGSICYIFAGFVMILSVTGVLVDLSVTIMQLEVSAAYIQVTVSAANRRVTIFIVIMQMRVALVITQVVFSGVHCAHDCFHCSYAGDFLLWLCR